MCAMMTRFTGKTKSVNILSGGCANHSSLEMSLSTFDGSKSEPEKMNVSITVSFVQELIDEPIVELIAIFFLESSPSPKVVCLCR